MGLETRHDMFLLKYLSVFARFRGSARILVEADREMFREQIGILKQKAVAGVGIENKPCIGSELEKPVGVRRRDHDVIAAIGDQNRRLDAHSLGRSIGESGRAWDRASRCM